MVTYPLAFLKYLIEVSLFVVALVGTKNLVCMILNGQRPDTIGALRRVLPQSREVLLLSLKYIAVLAVFGGVMIVIGSSPLRWNRQWPSRQKGASGGCSAARILRSVESVRGRFGSCHGEWPAA